MHLSDETLVRLGDGEIRGREEADARAHLETCAPCRDRLRAFEDAAAEFARTSDRCPLPAPEGPRALLTARLRELAAKPEPRRGAARKYGYAAVAAGLAAVVWLASPPRELDAMPRAELTPGSVRRVAAAEVCAANLGDNSDVVPAVQQLVFAEYGMPNAEAARYEVDYLITPALGGSDDIRNLWPQPYGGSPWNAYVKDALEERLRRMVCAGELDLATAQREIAVNWIAAYKKYFRTSRPLAAHVAPRP